MLRAKSVFAALIAVSLLAAPASAVTSKAQVVIVGSSAMWQSMALAAYNKGNCTTANVAVHPPCFHYTDNARFDLNDTRPTKVAKGLGGPGAVAVDTGDIWIVWDSPTGTQVRNVWVYLKVDSGVGVRCFFAIPTCTFTAPNAYLWNPVGQKIAAAFWGADVIPPRDVQALFPSGTAGLKVTTAASDIRPEDAMWATCRSNSQLGKYPPPGGFDPTDGLGYNAANLPGTCPSFGSTLGQLVGNPIRSGTSNYLANLLAFRVSGKDPFTNLAIPNYDSVSVGASPIVFVFSRSTTQNVGLNGAANATDLQLQTLYTANCDANLVNPLAPPFTAINCYLLEPISGVMNTKEATTFRRPVETIPINGVAGPPVAVSEEAAVKGVNPVANLPLGTGFLTRAIGTSEIVNDVQKSGVNNLDGIGYTFFSFGNVSSIAINPNYGYLTLDGVDPMAIPGTIKQELPTCAVSCPEAVLWAGNGGLSFPNLRDGTYPSWSLWRMLTNAATLVNVRDLVKTSQQFVVTDVPDYVPAVPVLGDPGLKVMRDHYTQCDGAATKATCPGIHQIGPPANNAKDLGGDMGGCIVVAPPAAGIIQIGLNGGVAGNSCSAGIVR